MSPAPPTAYEMPEDIRTTEERLRRLNLTMIVPPLAAVGALLVAVDARTWWEAVVLAVGVLAALVVVERWTAGDTSRVALPCLIVTAAVWPFGVLVADSHTAYYGITIVGPYLVPRLTRHRRAAALGLTAFVGAVGAAKLLESPDDVPGVLIQYVFIPAGITVVATGLMFANRLFYAFMEQAREREAELAVVRERIRFAGDLHDIQGHTLHVVKLKIMLAEKLMRTDVERAERELREVYALVGDTITETRELAHAQRRLNLAVELENARNLFEAAGIRVRVNRESGTGAGAGAGAGADERVKALLGQVLRETTTNILRHARATRVRITLSDSGISIVNDGAPETPLPALGGLAALGERVGDEGGELTVEQRDGRFLTAASFPGPRDATTPRPPEARPAEPRSPKARPAESRSPEPRPAEPRSPETRPAARPSAEPGPAEAPAKEAPSPGPRSPGPRPGTAPRPLSAASARSRSAAREDGP
ncbi:histidine kinase [Streptomyces sp. NPDC014894]|uniref:sensor histidine kinase n=1 Tax=Streptomyces sp. NPDC014894 TaxID=3364931 RepID=UPI0036F68509